jgi:hypothetical protein
MATLYISEYADVYRAPDGVLIPQEPSITDQTMTPAVGASQSSAFSPTTRFVRVNTDTACSLKFGTNPTATTTNKRMFASIVGECFAVPVGQSYKLSVIT